MNTLDTMKQAIVYFEHMVRTLKLRDESEPAQLLFKLRQAIADMEAQEPVAWINAEKRTFEWHGPVLWETPTIAVLDKIPLYTHPQPKAEQEPKREWVGLTDEEVVKLKMDGRDLEFVSMTALRRFAKSIEQALKKKNT